MWSLFYCVITVFFKLSCFNGRMRWFNDFEWCVGTYLEADGRLLFQGTVQLRDLPANTEGGLSPRTLSKLFEFRGRYYLNTS